MTQQGDPNARERYWQSVMERLRTVVGDDYRVLSLLGFGGMAGVFLAREKRPPRNVALKVMSPELMLGFQMVERFHQEAALQANLEHPNIAAVYAVREQGGLQFFSMQYVPGRTLQGALRAEREAGRRLSAEVIGTLVYQIGSALEYAHGSGVVHRDVKPGNVLLARDGRAVLTDFGIAKVAEGPGLTMTSAALGTAAYMSPEQCYAEESLTGASDQYSLGIMAFELMAGHVPFSGDPFRMQQAHVTQPPPDLRSLREDCPEHFARAVSRMLAKRPEDRFPDIASALEAMGASAPSPRRDDPVRLEMIRLADCEGIWGHFSDDVRREMSTPRSTEQISDAGQASSPSWSPDQSRVASIEIAELPAVLALGERCTLTATCRDAAGGVLQDQRIRWEIDPPEMAVVGSDGSLVCQRWGKVRLRAISPGASAEVPLAVGSVPRLRLELLRMPRSIAVGASATVAVRVTDARGRERRLPYLLVTSDPAVLAADGASAIHALAPGRAVLTARCGSCTQSIEVVVAPG